MANSQEMYLVPEVNRDCGKCVPAYQPSSARSSHHNLPSTLHRLHPNTDCTPTPTAMLERPINDRDNPIRPEYWLAELINIRLINFLIQMLLPYN